MASRLAILGYSLSGGGSGPPTPGPATTVELTGTAAEALAAGDLVYLDEAGGVTAGQFRKARADNFTTTDALGVVKSSVGAGASATVYQAGVVTVTMNVAPAATDNGKRVFVDVGAAGKGTITIPSLTGGFAGSKQIGRLIGADGATTTPTVLLEWQNPPFQL